MLAAAVIALLIGDTVEGIAVIAVIIINALFGFITEYQAEKSMESLRNRLSPEARVIRDGELQEIDAERLVPGDIIILEEGDRIPADGRLLQAGNLKVNESILTGESETVMKNTDKAEEELPLADRKNMVYMGTSVSRGRGRAVVTATGSSTEMGKIGALLEETIQEDTPLEERLNTMGKALVRLTLVIAVIITVIGIIIGRPWVRMLKTGIALAIAAVPEGLPIVATITLAIGMRKMVKKNALIRRLPAVETLGSTTTICTDKTGTITENQMTVRKIFLASGNSEINVTGTGYKPEGGFETAEGGKVNQESNQELQLFLRTGLFCNNASIREDSDNSLWKVIGDPTEGALVTAANKGGLELDLLEEKGYKRLAEMPFSSEDKYMAVSYQTPDDDNVIYIKGAPELILEMTKFKLSNDNNSEYKLDTDNNSDKIQNSSKQSESEINPDRKQKKELDSTDIDKFKEKNQEMAGKGLRVLGMAYYYNNSQAPAESEEEIKELIEEGAIFLGLVGIMDPPREDVKESIMTAHNAGIKTRMITGDQKDTAINIAEKVGISDNSGKAISGQEIEKMSPAELNKCIKEYSVFTRVSPENKLQIIDALNQSNELTAMTGDGVNDAPALKKADIGVSMGQRGTTVARRASDMILLDDSFSTIVAAIRQGRVIFDNIHKFIYYLFSSNLSEIVFIFLGIVLNLPVPLLALQILWLNLVVDVFPALSLGWEVSEPGIMSRSPRDPDKSILNNDFKKKLLLHSIIIALGPLITYILVLRSGYSLELSRTVSFAILSLTQLFHVFNARREKGSGFDSTVLKNKYLWAALLMSIFLQFIAIYNPLLQELLHTTSIPLGLWLYISAGFIIPIAIIQILKIRGK